MRLLQIFYQRIKHDFKWQPENYFVICINTPFKNKFLFFKRAMELKKPLCLGRVMLLLSIDSLEI
jgi:hypothetical protein